MAFSAWKIWFHPKFTARTLDAIEADALSSKEVCNRLAENIRKLNAENEQLSLTNSCLSSELEKTRKDLAEAREDIQAFSETETHLKEFEQALSAVEQMKANYENRIETLRKTIKSLKSLNNSKPYSGDLIEDIDMLSDSNAVSPSIKTPSGHNTTDEEEWLKSLP